MPQSGAVSLGEHRQQRRFKQRPARRSRCCKQVAVAETHHASAKSPPDTQIVLTLPVFALFDGTVEGTLMVSALVGAMIILSIGVLMAHALDAFRSG
jgi:hypothetical protein